MQDEDQEQMPEGSIKIEGDDNAVLQIQRADTVVIHINMEQAQISQGDRERTLVFGMASLLPIALSISMSTHGKPFQGLAFLGIGALSAAFALWPRVSR